MGRPKKFSDEELKARAKAHRDRPEAKARKKQLSQLPENKAKRKEYRDKLENKLRAKAHRDRPENKLREKKRSQLPERKAKKKKYLDENRLNVLREYSKRLSNSNIPCCACCREDFHIDFLALDHIAGRRQMDSESELIKLGYSSKLKGSSLIKWIRENNFPDGFQILCQNCNFAKGMKGNNNICPHEKARKEEAFAMMEEQSSFEV